ncbi:hypothetical protein SB717_38270, partial [Priestia sp. SIMBA_032]|uniref:hypothetical protein n=1 Tax=Priestia sp. SIMBA_032 TaxID=3085775 RepID=UPI003978B3F8
MHFRSDGKWEEIIDPNDPRFGFLEDWDNLDDFLAFISYEPHTDGAVHDLLHAEAIQWFDQYGN